QPAGAWNARAGHVAATVAPPVVVAWALALILAVLAEVRHDRQAHQVERATSAFLAVAGHELRTPLTSIRGFSQTLAQRWDSLPAGRRQEMVQAIARQSRLLEHLIERLLTAARLEAGTSSTLLLGPVDLTAVLQDVVEAHQPLAPLHEIRVEMAPGLTVHGDGGALGQVLGHLVENAVKYSPGGGLVTVSATRLRRRVEVAVEDDGVGLPSDFPRLFDRFAQAEPVDTRTYDEGGMGLGLFIARTLVEQMGGVIRAEPRQPRGARFVVRLVAAGDD
ncbi:MAG TPA: HAMP domain-containing sensor histidine kinase, partial [Acidimicrobiales bacterium]